MKAASKREPVTRDMLDSGQDISVLKVLLYQLEAPLAVRVILSLVFRLLRSRVDLGLISKLRQNELRGKAVELIREIVTSEPDAGDEQAGGPEAVPATARPAAVRAPAPSLGAPPVIPEPAKPAPTLDRGSRSQASPPQARTVPMRTVAPRPRRTRLPSADLGIEVAEIPSLDEDGILSMSADELEFFARTAHRDMQDMFVGAMHEKRKREYTQLLGGGFTVKVSTAARRNPPFRVFLAGARTCLLPEESQSACASLGVSEQQLSRFVRWIWDYWTYQRFPEHFRVEPQASTQRR